MFACGNSLPTETALENGVGFYSDYYVFISDDASSPIVIPLDLNWNLVENGYDIEFKAWHGTEDDWPINYTKQFIQSPNSKIPEETFELKNTTDYIFDSNNREITIQIQSAPKIKVSIPEMEEWVLAPSDGKTFRQTFAGKSSIKIENETITGWLLYERIRFDKNAVAEFGDFETFFWIPLIIDGELYHFEEHKGEQFAIKWFDDGTTIVSEEISNFNIAITETINDATSNRDKIPKKIQITSEENNFNISLFSSGEQVGYGDEFPKGLAYYRQSLLQSTASSELSGYGMMELIIENN